MTYKLLSIIDSLNTTLYTHLWTPTPDQPVPKKIIFLFHGMMEHGLRYEPFAEWFNKEGYIVAVPDLRGHGKTSQETGLGHFGENASWETVLKNCYDSLVIVKNNFPDLPVFI